MTIQPQTTQCLPVGRLVYAHLDQPSAPEGTDKLSYSITLSFPADEDLSKIEAGIQAAAQKKFGDKIPARLVNPLKPNDEQRKDDGSMRAGFHEGGHHITLKQADKADFQLFTLEGKVAEDRDFYPGCFVQAIGSFYGYKVTNAGVTVYLKKARFIRDGEPLGGGPEVEFEDVSDIDNDQTPF